jgi:hypothetical protein
MAHDSAAARQMPQLTGMYEWIVQIETRKLNVPVNMPHHSRMLS